MRQATGVQCPLIVDLRAVTQSAKGGTVVTLMSLLPWVELRTNDTAIWHAVPSRKNTAIQRLQ